jgi:polysaccharide export outer membrane protein
MNLSRSYLFPCLRSARWRVSFAAASVFLGAGQLATVARSQQPQNMVQRASDLAVRNMSRVSASPEDIKSVLLRDTGLMVELKRWVAKDATNQGQVVVDSDLTNEAIFDRLETDVQFRSVATNLVQQYGYLLPNLNPASDAAKQRDLLLQERVKRLAQRQDEELVKSRQQEMPGVPESRPASTRYSSLVEEPNKPSNYAEPSVPYSPGDLIRTQLDQIGEPAGEPFMLPVPGSNPLQAFQNISSNSNLTTDASANPNTNAKPNANFRANMFDAPTPEPELDGTQPREQARLNAPAARNPFEGGNDGLLAAYGPMATSKRKTPQGQAVELAAQPEMIRKLTPYTDVPSLYDMYVQAVPRPESPRRFGTDVFENGSQNPQLIPMDLPVGPDYVVGPGDALSVDLWGGVSQRLYRTVDREGRVSLPEVGPILVSGKSLAAVQENLQQVLRTQFRNVSADVSLARLRTIRIYEVGDVTHPGAYDISSLSTPLNALFAAAGPTERGSMRILKHYRGAQLVQTVDVYDLLLHGVKTDLQRLENGDTVQVPSMGPQVTIEGMVRRPAIYETRDEKTLSSVIELAGGLLPTAALGHIEVQRIVDHQRQTMLSLDIPEAEASAGVIKKLDAFEIHDGDRIRVFPIAPYNQDSIFLEGHVIRPGRYSFHPEMRVNEVISSYKDLLPEPANQYAEIIRLNPPDFHPSVEGFDLADALANPAQAPILRAMDTIRIYSRFDFENPPTVSVLGNVRAPGTYKTTGEIRLIDAIHLAGGLSPDAQTEDAQVFRYLPDGKSKIFSVRLSLALAGNPAENIVLQPRDRLLIHEQADAAEPATIYVQGEVEKPGRYPLTGNMRVADLIRIGGGLKPGADAQTADLTQYQWSGPGLGPERKILTGIHEVIALSAALINDPNSNLALHNGDVLTIRQLPGWNDLGASISLKGELRHPGTYGIRPGERLSSVLQRAGGFSQEAYPYGAVLQRPQVREVESKAQAEILTRLRAVQSNLELLPETDSKQKEAKAMAMQQAQASIEQMKANPVLGRLTIRISSQIDRWKNSPADIEIRTGDTLVIPKKPSYVMVTGQVFNPTAVSFRPGKGAKWYLGQSGGPTQLGNKKGIFVIRGDGSVVGVKSGLWSGETLSAALQPGDTVVVPERAIAGGLQWQNVLLTAQTATAIASAVFIAVRY